MMQEYDVDFHIHSRYSGGVSPEMRLPVIAGQAKLKGLDVVATGDCIHGKWLKHLETVLFESAPGLYSTRESDTKFIIQTEVEDDKRIHHVILLPSLESARELRKLIKPHSVNIDTDGRPNVKLSAEKIAETARQVGGLIGPSHAFTPYTAIFKPYDTVRDCYKSQTENVHFLELGLSADTGHADTMSQLDALTFMSNSDCHSPWPHRLGREFNRLKMKNPSYPEIEKAIKREGGRKFTLNVGLNPLEGKYHLTACTKCHKPYLLKDARLFKRRCQACRGMMKIGVSDRIMELSDRERGIHPPHRPPYLHILPLAEVISLASGVKTLTSKRIQEAWKRLVENFQSEINVLIDADIPSLRGYDETIADIIARFRSGKIYYRPGGGGVYGMPSLDKVSIDYYNQDQKTLKDY